MRGIGERHEIGNTSHSPVPEEERSAWYEEQVSNGMAGSADELRTLKVQLTLCCFQGTSRLLQIR